MPRKPSIEKLAERRGFPPVCDHCHKRKIEGYNKPVGMCEHPHVEISEKCPFPVWDEEYELIRRWYSACPFYENSDNAEAGYVRAPPKKGGKKKCSKKKNS